MELLAKKIEERFSRLADAYMYFSTYATRVGQGAKGPVKVPLALDNTNDHFYHEARSPFDNSITLNDFIVAADSMRLKLT